MNGIEESVKIKALIWEERKGISAIYLNMSVAKAPMGTFIVATDSNEHWFWSLWGVMAPQYCDNEDLAKKAAEAHNTQCVLASIEKVIGNTAYNLPDMKLREAVKELLTASDKAPGGHSSWNTLAKYDREVIAPIFRKLYGLIKKPVKNGEVELGELECVVALTETSIGQIVVRSNHIKEVDLLMEETTEDNGFNSNWDDILNPGLYKVSLKPWSRVTSEGEIDTGIDVVRIESLFAIKNAFVMHDDLEYEECSDCIGKGLVLGIDGEPTHCKNCGGSGVVPADVNDFANAKGD